MHSLLTYYDEKLHLKTVWNEGYEARQEEVDELKNANIALNATIQDKDAEIASTKVILANKDAEIASTKVILANKDAALANMDAALADKDAALANKDAEIEELKRQLAEVKK